MTERRLPNLQLLLAVLFSIAAIFAPLLMARGNLVIGTLVALGLLLSGVTLTIGWRATMQKRPVTYPFYDWSLVVLRVFGGDSQVREMERASRGRGKGMAVRGNLRLLGIANLALGSLLLVGMLYAVFILLY